MEPLEDRRVLATITVTSLADSGAGSLRDALDAAAPLDTIDFSPSLFSSGPQSIVLTSGELLVETSLTIDGPGANLLTIDASGNDATPTVKSGDGSRVFNIDDGDNEVLIDVEIEGVTIMGGDLGESAPLGDGGGIRTLENLTISTSTVTNMRSLRTSWELNSAEQTLTS